MPNALVLRVTLLDLDPTPWREIEVPLTATLADLDRMIEAAFLWQEAHLWQFEIADRIYGPEAENFAGFRTYRASGMKLSRLHELRITDFLYRYDMGDDWQHRVQMLESRTTDDPLPRFVGGQWRCPPEDVGGPPGFEGFLAALADPAHPEHDDLMDWHGGPFEPSDIGEAEIGRRMAELVKRRGRRR